MKLTKAALLVSLAFNGPLFAQDIEIVGNVSQSVQIPQNSLPKKLNTQTPLKHITLLKIQLSPRARAAIEERSVQIKPNQDNGIEGGERSVQLGMNNVPVLDQGGHGTCTTFANIAALDAAINKGDYVSSLCTLQLGRFFEKNAYSPSGWKGSLGRIVLNQLDTFGLVTMENQKTQGCGGLKDYPLYGPDPEGEVSINEYHNMSQSLKDYGVAWSPILDIFQFYVDKTNTEKTLEEVKAALRSGDRVTFGILLPDTHLGVGGALGRHHMRNDTWVLTPELQIDVPTADTAHEMVITGYDDDALAKDDQGREYQGLLTLRNSWGTNIGDKGEFYMTYEYFKTLVIEAQRIRHLS